MLGATTVTVVMRVRQRTPDGSKWAVDNRGNAVYVNKEIAVSGCSVQPGSSTESEDDGRVRVTSIYTIYAPLTWPAGPVDAVRFGGLQWEVQGQPQRWDDPRLGHVVVTVQEARA